MARVGVVGLGKFGAAFVQLAEKHGHEVRGSDASGSGSLDEVVRFSDILVLAVPVPALRALLVQVRPLLRVGQLVLDVGSTKVGPDRDLREVLGGDFSWVATHPLFGPVSLSRGEPQKVIVCPNGDVTAKADAFFESVGCTVVHVSAEEHDRVMSRTHVLAFFVAKALQEIGAASAPFAPPSFQSMARVVDLVREDAGHLFEAIQTSNPFAAEAREALIEALTRIDASLR
jgi:prephenate dehydrogenase